MKKQIVILMAALMSISLAGCGSKTSDSASSNDTSDSTTVQNSIADEKLSAMKLSDTVTLGEYNGITVSVDAVEATDQEIQDKIDSDLKAQATDKEITDRAVQDEDIVNIDYVGKIDGEAFDGGTSGDGGVDLTIGSGSFIPGFESGLIGAKVGETKDLNLTFPDTYGKTELAGKDAVFTVSINSIKEAIVPELTDEVAAKIDQSVTNVEDYKKNVKINLENTKKTSARSAARSSVLQMVTDGAEIKEVPDWLLEDRINYIQNSAETYAKQYGMEFDQFLSQLGQTQEQFDEDTKTYAEQDAKQTMVIYAIAQAEDLGITDEEFDQQVSDYATTYGYSGVEEFKSTQDMGSFREYLQSNSVLDFLMANAKFVDANGNAIDDIDVYLTTEETVSSNDIASDTTSEDAVSEDTISEDDAPVEGAVSENAE